MIQTRVMADDPGATRDDLANKLEEVKHLNYLVFEKVPLQVANKFRFYVI